MSEERQVIVPDKLYFRIGEVSRLVGVKPYVLRYWETEFSDVKPDKSKSGQRLYRRRDVESLLSIRELLYEHKFTISGARKRLKELNKKIKTIVEPSRQMEVFSAEMKAVEEVSIPEVTDATQPEPHLEKIAHDTFKASSNLKIIKRLKRELESLLEEIRS